MTPDVFLWLMIGGTCVICGVWMAWPYLRATSMEMSGAEGAISIYRDQLDEIERDQKQGLITETEAESARQEVERRALHAARHLDSGMATSHRSLPKAGAVAAAGIAVAVGLYGTLGAPSMGDAPLAERRVETLTAQANAGDLNSRIQLLLDRTRENPESFEDWWRLGQAYAAVGDHSNAAEAYRQAAEKGDDRPAVLSAYAEAMTLANGNKVPPAARVIFEQVMRETGEPRAMYYSALARAQSQDFEGALAGWVAMLEASDPTAPWVATVRRDIVNMARFLKRDVTEFMPDATADEISAAGGAPHEGKGAVGADQIAEMEAKLAEDPMDWETWITLAKARAQKGDNQGAADTIAKARLQFRAAPFLMQKLAETERSLGLDMLTTPQVTGDTGVGPDAKDVAAAAEMSATDRDDMINGMVAGLAARLQESPNDPDGWVMLIRSYVTLGKTEAAKEALGTARELFSADAGVMGAIEQAVSDLAL